MDIIFVRFRKHPNSKIILKYNYIKNNPFM